MKLSQISEARERRNARAMRAKRKAIEEARAKLPVVRLFRAVGIEAEPGKVLLQMFGDIEHKNLLAVSKLNESSLKDLIDNIQAAAGVHKQGLIWTP